VRIPKKLAQIVFFAILACVAAVAFMTADERYVAVPGFACVIMFLWLWMTLWDRDRGIPFFDAGVFCALATLVYTVYPLVNYWVDGLQFGFLSDWRLQQLDISPRDLGFFHLRHVLYLFSFTVAYLAFRGKGTIETGNVVIPRRSTRQVIFLFFILFSCYFILLQVATGINYNTSYESDAFEQNTAAIASAPLLILQISGKLGGILFIFKLAVLFIVISRCRDKKWLAILLIWVAAEITNAFILKGARTGLVLFIIAAVLLYHRMIRPFSMKFLVISGTSLLIFFIFLGLSRSYIDLAEFKTDMVQSEASFFSGGNEFQSILGTSFDVFKRKEADTYFPWYLYINDIITILPPQQLLPFEKIRASDWYLREIHLENTGIGYMWGVISQSIVGLDWLELAIRGALLGYILALLHRWYLKRQAGFLATLFYAFLCLKVYYTFRDTTFILLANLVWEIIPFYLLLRLGLTILAPSMRGQKQMTSQPHLNTR
jgi:hypothetical protein